VSDRRSTQGELLVLGGPKPPFQTVIQGIKVAAEVPAGTVDGHADDLVEVRKRPRPVPLEDVAHGHVPLLSIPLTGVGIAMDRGRLGTTHAVAKNVAATAAGIGAVALAGTLGAPVWWL
jgi:hypothetical protein